jgi:hypothetical protein
MNDLQMWSTTERFMELVKEHLRDSVQQEQRISIKTVYSEKTMKFWC